MMFASFHNDCLMIRSKKAAGYFLELMNKTLSKSKHRTSYNFTQFFNVYSDYYCNNYPVEVIAKLIPEAAHLFDYPLYSHDVISVEIAKRDEREDAYSFVIKWLSKAIRNISSSQTEKIFKNLMSTHNDLEALLAIYTASVHFSVLRGLFFDNLNLLSKRRYFSEIYSLLQNNAPSLTDKELAQTIYFVEKIQYGNQYTNIFCQYYVLRLLANNFPNDSALLEKTNHLNSQIVSHYGEESLAQFDPLEASKDFRVSVKWEEPDSKEFREKVLSMDLDGFISYLKDSDSSASSALNLYRVSNMFDELETKFDFYNLTVLHLLRGLPDEFYDILEAQISHSKLDLKSKFNRLVSIEELKTNSKSHRQFLNSLYFELSNTQDIANDLRESIFNYVKSINIDLPQTDYDMPSAQVNLFSNSCFLKYSVLIETCGFDDFHDLIVLFESESMEHKKYVNAAISSRIHFLWRIDSNWIIKHLTSIFSSLPDGENLSFEAFSYSLFYEPVFVDRLDQENLLEPLLSSKEFDGVAMQYASLLLWNYLYSGKNESAVRTISKTSHYDGSLALLLDYVKRTNRDKFDDDKFDHILSTLMENGKKNEGLYGIGIKILDFFDPYEINPVRLDFVKFAFSFKNSSFKCGKLTDILNKKDFSEKVKNIVSKAFLMKLDDCFFNEDEICKLFNLVGNDSKTEVMNSLGNTNPELLLKLAPEQQK